MAIYAILLALVSAVSAGLAVYSWPRRRETAVTPFMVAAAAGAFWPLLLLVEMALPGVEAKSWATRLRTPFILAAASAMLVMALRHGGWTGSAKRLAAALSVMPLLSLLFNFLPFTRGWFQHNFRPHPEAPGLLAYDYGRWVRVYEVYAPLLALAVVVVLLMQARQYRTVYRRRALVLAVGVLTPTMLYILQLAGMLKWTPLNVPTLGMGVTVLCCAWVLLRNPYFGLAPVARFAIIEQWDEPVVAVNARGEIVDLNPAAARVLGAELGSRMGALREPWATALVTMDGREPQRGQLQAEGRSYSYETLPLHDEAGVWQGWVLLVRDQTESESARRALEALNAELQAEIRQRRATEARLMEAHRIETIGRLSGGVAHEFNNLTMVINGYSNLLLARMRDDDENRPAMQAIAQAGEDAARLTAQLLEFSRKQVLRSELVDVRMLVREARHMWATLLGERIRLRLVEPAPEAAGPAWAAADAAKLREALTQLILNARDAMPGGGVVAVTVERKTVGRGALMRTPGFAPGEYICVSVADTGIGMDADTLSHALEPFFSTKGVGHGSGLGLSSAYGIARQCGGTLELESEPGAGTTARFYLPLAAAPEEDALPAEPLDAAQVAAARVLVVEDQPDVRRLLCALLEAEGHEVLQAGGAAAALQILAAESPPPRLMITDLVMPGLSGYDLVRRATAIAPDLRVLVISGYSHEETGPCDGFLHKPFTPDQFNREIRRLLKAR